MQTIDINQIALSRQNMRQHINDDDNGGEGEDTDVTTLAQSIKSQGLLNPILVRPVSQNRYEVYAGHRRLLAAKQLKWDSIPCLVSNINDRDAKLRSLIENYQRRDNTYEEKIRTFDDLYQNECNRDLKQLCQTVGTKPATVKRYLRLCSLPLAILGLLDGERRLTLKNAELLVNIDETCRQELADQIVKAELSSIETESVIRLFQKDQDLSKIADFINRSIEDSAKRRTQKRAEAKSGAEAAKKVAQEVVEESSEREESSPEEKEKPKREREERAEDDGLVGDPMDKRVNKSKQPWLYDPSDKLKLARPIPEKHLKTFWELYEKTTK